MISEVAIGVRCVQVIMFLLLINAHKAAERREFCLLEISYEIANFRHELQRRRTAEYSMPAECEYSIHFSVPEFCLCTVWGISFIRNL